MNLETNGVLKLENQICFPLYAASREVTKKLRDPLEAISLTYTQYVTMMVLWEMKKANVKEIGDRLYLDSGTLTPVLKTLEKKGFLRRARYQADERYLTVQITKNGEELKQKAIDIPKVVEGYVNLTKTETETLCKILNKLLK